MDTLKKLRNLGRKIAKYLASPVDKLLQLLEELELVLSNIDQDPAEPIQESLVLPMKTLISDELLKHADEDVKISVTACLTEIARITAPDSPYDDEKMKEFLKLTVEAFEKLSHVSGRRYEKALTILENVSKIKIFLIMLDLECDDLVIEMFQHFLRIIRSNHPSNVIESMEIVMTGILDESEEISSDLVRPLLDSVRKENQTISPLSWKLGEKVITNCAVKLKPYLIQAVESSGRALDEYAQIVISICQNESESSGRNHSKSQAVENNLSVPKILAPPVKKYKLIVKMGGKLLAPPEPKCNKRRKQTATSSKGFNKLPAMEAHEPQDLDNSLVGKRIKVWWPLDKIYYEGVLDSYDHVEGEHKILYDDGDEELLNLKNERWELADVIVSQNEEEAIGLQKLAEASEISEEG